MRLADDEASQLDAIEQLLMELLERFGRMEATLAGNAAADVRHVNLLAQLEASMDKWDLPFTSGEVIEHSRGHFGLDEALQALGIHSVADCGALFRALRDRDLGGRRLVRDGRSWRLVRT